MMRKLRELVGYHLHATDGNIGMVKDFYFDCNLWKIRYLVADTGTWLPGRKVLISPHAMGEPDWVENLFPVNLSKDEIKHSPSIEADKPVSRKNAFRLYQYYGWPITVGEYPHPKDPSCLPEECGLNPELDTTHEESLRSLKEIYHYHLLSDDGPVGMVEDLIVDKDGEIKYLVADINSWLPGGKVLIATSWIEDINYDESYFRIKLTKEQIKESPAYHPAKPVTREYEEQLFDHYGRPKYWVV